MKNCFILLSFCCFILELTAQNFPEYELRWGPEAELLRHTEIENLISMDDEFVYVVAVTKSRVSVKRYVLKYDRNTLEMLDQTEVILRDGRNVYEFHVVLDDQLYFFSSETVRLNNRTTLSYRIFNIETMQFDGDYVEVLQAKPKKRDGLIVIGSAGDEFDFLLSRNKNQLLIYNVPDKRERENFEVQLKLFGPNMESIWESEIEIPYQTRYVNSVQVVFGDVGEIYLACRVENGERRRSSGPPNYFYTLLNISEDGRSFDELKIDTKDKHVKGCIYRFNYHTGALIMACNYSEKYDDQTRGVLINTINVANFTSRNHLLYDFDEQFLSNFLNDRQLRRGSGISNLSLDYIAVHSDGTYTLSGEIGTVRYIRPEGSQLTTTQFSRKEIIVMQLNHAFEVNWVKHIAKHQGSVNDNAITISYFALYNDDFLSYFFNDWEENEKVFEADELFMRLSGPTALMNVVVDRNGSMRKLLMDSKTAQGDFILPDSGSVHRTSNDEFILFGRKQALFRLGVLSQKQ